MKFTVYLAWTISAPFFIGGVVWVFAPFFIPLWAVALGMVSHLCVWGSVQERMTENDWDK